MKTKRSAVMSIEREIAHDPDRGKIHCRLLAIGRPTIEDIDILIILLPGRSLSVIVGRLTFFGEIASQKDGSVKEADRQQLGRRRGELRRGAFRRAGRGERRSRCGNRRRQRGRGTESAAFEKESEEKHSAEEPSVQFPHGYFLSGFIVKETGKEKKEIPVFSRKRLSGRRA
jgi:hypothetical protein